jgi:peptidoglycan-associated lipoprotein
MRGSQESLGWLLALGVAFGLVGCTPTYPKCDKDEHCKKGEYCINGMCQQCRDSKDCPKGETCKGGRCEAAKGYCETSDDCPEGGACKNNKCVRCASDADCGPGWRCSQGKCLKAGQCATDADCPQNHECQNGRCVAPPAPDTGAAKCTPETIYFDFDEFVLTSEASAKLQAGATCIKSVPKRVIRVEGHCDSRGTEEYNLALGDRRAQSVKRYLERLGVEAGRMRTVSKGKLEAVGTNAEGWAKDRKVPFFWE